MADIALGFVLYLNVVIEGVAGYAEDFPIEYHLKVAQKQDSRLAMLFFYKP